MKEPIILDNLYKTINATPENSPAFPQTILRDVLIPSLLGQETDGISYWAGKDLARKFPIGSAQDAVTFFAQAGFGRLTLTEQNAQKAIWTLSGHIVALRLKTVGHPNFALEAGFLAEMTQQQLGGMAEAELIATPRQQRDEMITIAVYTEPTASPLAEATNPLTIVTPHTTDLDEAN